MHGAHLYGYVWKVADASHGFSGLGSASEREAERVFMPTEYEYQPLDELIATPPFTRCACYYRYTYGVWQGCIATDCFYGRIFLL